MSKPRHGPASALRHLGFAIGGVLATAPTARAQQAVADGYASVPLQSGATLSLWGSEPYQPGNYALTLGLEVRSLLIASEADAATDDLAGSVSSFELLGSLGLWRGIDVSAAIALDRASIEAPDEDDGAAQSRGALGEVRLIPRARLLGVDAGSGLAVLLPVGLPSKSNDLYAARSVRVEPRLAGTLHGGWLIATTNVGYTVHATEEALGTGSTNFVSGGVGAEFRIVPAWSMLAELAGRWSPHDRAATNAGGLSTEAHAAARFSSSGWAAQFGAGTGLTSALLEPDWRMLASVSFSPAPADAPPPAMPVEPAPTESSDSYLSETADWHPPPAPDDANAPEAPPPAKIGAATPGPVEPRRQPPTARLSAEEEIAKLERALAGAPRREPAAAKPGAEGDIAKLERSVARPPRRKPRSAAAREAGENAELKRALARVPAPLPVIDDVIHFAPNQMRLSTQQLAALDSVVVQLEAAPRDAQLVVEGHSDSAGPRGFNWRLSRMRASTVRFHLIEAGIAWRRISVRAYGASRPLEGGAAGSDRRVEFRLIRSSELQRDTP